MDRGHLIVETSDAHPGWVRIYTSETPPPMPVGSDPGSAPRPRLVAYFNDLSAARMHAHELLRRRLVDAEAGLYRATAVEAAAAVESIALTHRRVYLDPAVAAQTDLQAHTARLRARRLRAERTWRIVGVAAVLLLVIRVLFGF
jgi:hypothetical protein